MWGSGDRKTYLREAFNPRTEKLPPFFVSATMSLAVAPEKDRVMLVPNPSTRDTRADGSSSYNPFLSMSKRLQMDSARLCLTHVHVAELVNDLPVPIVAELENIFSTDSVHGSNMPIPKAEEPEGDAKEDEPEKPCPETTNHLLVHLAPGVRQVVAESMPVKIYQSVVPESVQKSHGGYDAVYRGQPQPVVTYNADGTPKPVDDSFQLLEETHPLVSDLRKMVQTGRVSQGALRQVTGSDGGSRVRVEKEALIQTKNWALNTIFEDIRYTDFAETTLSANFLTQEAQETLNRKYLKLLLEDPCAYRPIIHFILQVHAVRVNPGISETRVRSIWLDGV